MVEVGEGGARRWVPCWLIHLGRGKGRNGRLGELREGDGEENEGQRVERRLTVKPAGDLLLALS